MIECRPNNRLPLERDDIQPGLVVHLRATSLACEPWLVIGQEGVSPLLGEDGWRLMEIGATPIKNPTGKPMGKDGFTGRTSVLRPTHLASFHVVRNE